MWGGGVLPRYSRDIEPRSMETWTAALPLLFYDDVPQHPEGSSSCTVDSVRSCRLGRRHAFRPPPPKCAEQPGGWYIPSRSGIGQHRRAHGKSARCNLRPNQRRNRRIPTHEQRTIAHRAALRLWRTHCASSSPIQLRCPTTSAYPEPCTRLRTSCTDCLCVSVESTTAAAAHVQFARELLSPQHSAAAGDARKRAIQGPDTAHTKRPTAGSRCWAAASRAFLNVHGARNGSHAEPNSEQCSAIHAPYTLQHDSPVAAITTFFARLFTIESSWHGPRSKVHSFFKHSRAVQIRSKHALPEVLFFNSLWRSVSFPTGARRH
jgi:hypothetical protein